MHNDKDRDVRGDDDVTSIFVYRTKEIEKIITSSFHIFNSLSDFEHYANATIYKHGLVDWEFELCNAISYAGMTEVKNANSQYEVKSIKMSRRFVKMNISHIDGQVELIDTLLHEIAHAIHYDNDGILSHEGRWKEFAIAVGGTGDILLKESNGYAALHTHVLESEKGDVLFHYYRKPKKHPVNEFFVMNGSKVIIKPVK